MENLQSDHLDTQNLYRDMQKRTGGEIYIGVVGPVRTGKSTFIKRFMDVAVLPYMEDAAQKTRAQDELPQSAGGRTITTTEPKFIPQEAVELKLAGEVTIRVRLVDCVGFMVEGAAGHLEDGAERLVKTPWYDHEIPFTQAAELGTRKVITDHSTIGVVVTTDGSFSDLPQETYLDAENQAISELKSCISRFWCSSIPCIRQAVPHGRRQNGLKNSIASLRCRSTVRSFRKRISGRSWSRFSMNFRSAVWNFTCRNGSKCFRFPIR